MKFFGNSETFKSLRWAFADLVLHSKLVHEGSSRNCCRWTFQNLPLEPSLYPMIRKFHNLLVQSKLEKAFKIFSKKFLWLILHDGWYNIGSFVDCCIPGKEQSSTRGFHCITEQEAAHAPLLRIKTHKAEPLTALKTHLEYSIMHQLFYLPIPSSSYPWKSNQESLKLDYDDENNSQRNLFFYSSL